MRAKDRTSKRPWTKTRISRGSARQMTPSTEIPGGGTSPQKKPRLALAIATALGVGYLPKAPGTFGSLVGVLTAVLSAVFFLRPTSLREVFSLHPLTDAVFSDNHFLVPGSDIHNST